MRWFFGPQQPIVESLRTRLGKTAVIYLAAAINSIGLGIANLGLVFFLKYKFHASASVIGIIASANLVAYFFGCFLLRPLSKALLPRYSLILSAGLNGVFVILTLLSPRIEVAGFWASVNGLSLALFWPPMMSWISAGLEGKNLNTTLSRFNFSWSIGVIVSPFIAGYLTERAVGLPFMVAAAMYFSVCLLIATASLAIHSVRSDRHLEPKSHAVTGGDDQSAVLRFPAWVGLVSTYAVLGIVNVVFPIYGVEAMGLAERNVGLVLLTRGIATTAGFYLMGRFHQWHFKRLPVIGVQIVTAASILLLFRAGSVALYYIAVPIIGLLSSASYSFSVFYGANGAAERAKRMALHEALLVAGMVVGSSLGGVIYQRASMQAVYLFALSLAGAAMATQMVLMRLSRQKIKHQQQPAQ